MIEIIDNFLDATNFNTIKNFIDNPKLSWTRGRMLPENLILCNKEQNFQDGYILYCNGNYILSELEILFPILKKLQTKVLLKAKINKTYPTEKNTIIGWHTDITKEHWAIDKNPMTAIYYINTNDGYTIIKENEKENFINCVENRIVIFDACLKHTAVTCSKSEYKLLVNINFL